MTDSTRPTQEAAINIQMVRDLYGAFSRRDIASVLAVLSPDVEWAEPDHPLNFVHLVSFKDRQIVRFQEFFDTYAAGEAFRGR